MKKKVLILAGGFSKEREISLITAKSVSKNLKVNYGQVVAVKKVDLHVAKGETVVLLGANGAGKSSTLLSIAGVSNKGGGEVDFLGSSITKLSPEKILSMGIATVPENGHSTGSDVPIGENHLYRKGQGRHERRRMHDSPLHLLLGSKYDFFFIFSGYH